MEKFKRKDLKRPDQFVATTQAGILWAADHRSKVIGVAVALVAVLLAAVGASAVSVARNRQANEDLSQGLAALQAEKFGDAAKSLGEVAERWQGRGAGSVAQLFAAQANLRDKKFEAVSTGLASLAESSSAASYLRQQAQVTQAAAVEEQGDAAKAAEIYAAARADGAGPFTGIALLGEARCRDRANDKAKATALYQAYVDEYPTSADQGYVASRLAALKGS